MYGFSRDDVELLAEQGIKPWEPEARAALAVLRGEDDDYDDYDDEYDDDLDDDVEFVDFSRRHFIGGEEPLDFAKHGQNALHQLAGSDASRKEEQGAIMSPQASAEAKAIAAQVNAERREQAEGAKAEGNTLVATKEWAQAKSRYSVARKLQPLNHVYHSNYAMVCLELAKAGGDREAALIREAEDAAAICVFLAPDWPKGYARLGTALMAGAQPAKARAVFEMGRSKVRPSERQWWRTKTSESEAHAREQEYLVDACLAGVDPFEGSIKDWVASVDGTTERRIIEKLTDTSLNSLLLRVVSFSSSTPTPCTDWQEQRAACRSPEFRVLLCRLIQLRADVNSAGASGREGAGLSPLHWATELGDVDLIEWLLEAGASCDIKVRHHNAIGLAIDTMERSHENKYEGPYNSAVVYKLLEHATPDQLNCWLLDNEHVGSGGGSHMHASVLAKACSMLDVQLVRVLLEKGADPEFPREAKRDRKHCLPLYNAVVCFDFGHEDSAREESCCRRLEIVNLLLDAGAQVTETDLLVSCQADPTVKKLLLERGSSNPSLEPVHWNGDGTTAMLRRATDETISALSVAPNLRELEFYNCMDVYALAKHDFPRIEVLDLSGVYVYEYFSRYGPENAEEASKILARFPNLRVLRCHGSGHQWFSGEVFCGLGKQCPKLTSIAVSGTNDTHEGEGQFCLQDDELASTVGALAAIKELQLGEVGSWKRVDSEGYVDGYSQYGLGDGSTTWTAGALHLTVACLPALLQLKALTRLCLNSYTLDEGRCRAELELITLELHGSASNLQHLALRLPISDQNLGCIARHAPNLLTVAICSPAISDDGIGEISACAQLQSFQLDDTKKPTDTGMQKLAQCKQLEEVRVSSSHKLTDASILALAAAGQLRTLQLRGRRQGFATAKALAALVSQCPQLRLLQLSGQRRMDPAAIQALSVSGLQSLVLYCDFERADVLQVGELLSTGFTSLEHWSWGWPDSYSPRICKAAGLAEQYGGYHWLKVDSAAPTRLVEYVREHRPGLKVHVASYKLGCRWDEGASMESSRAVLATYASRKGIQDMTCGYDSEAEEAEEEEVAQTAPAQRVAASPMPSASEEQATKACAQCKESLPQASFAKRQWKSEAGRCKRCTAGS